MEQTLLQDQLFAFSNGEIDHFLIRHDEIPFVAVWLAVRGFAAYNLHQIEINDEVYYEVHLDYWRGHLHVGVPNPMPQLQG